jgi:hypothetical protein
MYSLVVNTTSCFLPDGGEAGKFTFEPGYVLNNLPQELFKTGYTPIVTISDGSETLEYNLEAFLSKDYRTDGKTIRFGGKRVAISSLSITIGFKVIFENIEGLIDKNMD